MSAYSTQTETETNDDEMLVPGSVIHSIASGHVRVPKGIKEILEFLFKEVLRDQPQDIIAHCALLLESKIRREENERRRDELMEI